MSQEYLAEHRGSTNWGDRRSNQHKWNQMLIFGERGKPDYPGKNLSEQSREPTNSTHIWRPIQESNPDHIDGRPVLSPLHQHGAQVILVFKAYHSIAIYLTWSLNMNRPGLYALPPKDSSLSHGTTLRHMEEELFLWMVLCYGTAFLTILEKLNL